MEFCSLGSGSRGNGTLVRTANTCVLVDCGFSLKQLERRLRAVGVNLGDLDAVLLTHEHGDHVAGVPVLKNRCHGLAIHATAGTWRGMKSGRNHADSVLSADQSFTVGDLTVLPVTVPHDAKEPVQFRFDAHGSALGILTDLGHPSAHVIECFRGCDGILLEFNHEPALLAASAYPESVKLRVGGPLGHLANGQSAQLLSALEPERLQVVMAGHLSERNNTREYVEGALEAVMGRYAAACHIAQQQDCSGWFEVVR